MVHFKSPDHSNNYVLSFAFAFDTDDERYQFALCYPYSYSRYRTVSTADVLTFITGKYSTTTLAPFKV